MTTRAARAQILAGLAFVIVAFGGVLAAPNASAHSQLVSTSPADGSVLTEAPQRVTFTFSEDLLPGVDTIAVSDENGRVLSTATVEPQGESISADWPADASEGVFQAAYRIVSGDGHPVTGAIVVQIETSGSAAASEGGTVAAPTATSPPTADPAGDPAAAAGEAQPRHEKSGAWFVAALTASLVLALVGFLVWNARRRRSRSATGG